MIEWCNEKDLYISREEKDSNLHRGVAYDCDGNRLFTFPIDWTDEEVKVALSIANRSYLWGFKAGENSIRQQLKSILNISEGVIDD